MDRVTETAPGPMQSAQAPGPPVGPQVIFAVDAHCVCTLSTGPGLAALGVEPGQLVGLNLYELYGDDAHAQESLRRALSGEAFSTETPFHGRTLSVFYQPAFGPDGEVTGAIGVSTDVTEQRRVEAEVRAARERATLLADLSAVLNREVHELDSLLHQVARSAAQGFRRLRCRISRPRIHSPTRRSQPERVSVLAHDDAIGQSVARLLARRSHRAPCRRLRSQRRIHHSHPSPLLG